MENTPSGNIIIQRMANMMSLTHAAIQKNQGGKPAMIYVSIDRMWTGAALVAAYTGFSLSLQLPHAFLAPAGTHALLRPGFVGLTPDAETDACSSSVRAYWLSPRASIFTVRTTPMRAATQAEMALCCSFPLVPRPPLGPALPPRSRQPAQRPVECVRPSQTMTLGSWTRASHVLGGRWHVRGLDLAPWMQS